MTQYSFDDVVKIDQALYQLSIYEVTKGLIIVPKSQEELIDLQDKIAGKFNYFKMLIQNGECTFHYIKQSVLQKNGPFPRPEPFDIDKVDFKQLDANDDIREKEKNVHNFAEELLKAFLPTGSKETAEDLVDKFGIKVTVRPLNGMGSEIPQIDKPMPENCSLPKKKTKKKPPSKKNSLYNK